MFVDNLVNYCDDIILAFMQGITTDNMIPEGANERVIEGQVVYDIHQYYAVQNPDHLAAANARILPDKPAFAGPEVGEL